MAVRRRAAHVWPGAARVAAWSLVAIVTAPPSLAAAELPDAVIDWGDNGPVAPEDLRHFHDSVQRALTREWGQTLSPEQRAAATDAHVQIDALLGERERWNQVPYRSLLQIIAAHDRVIDGLELPPEHKLHCERIRPAGTRRKDMYCSTYLGAPQPPE